MADRRETKNGLRRALLGEGKISLRFRNCNIALFVLSFLLMLTAMLMVFNNIIGKVSSDYASRYAVSSADALSANITKEVSLMSKAARSRAVIDWLSDEHDSAKKALAFEEMSAIIGELYSNNLYVGFAKSLHEYKIDEQYTADSMKPFDTLDKHNPQDTWYFDCVASNKDYLLNIGIDNVLHRKRVWLDYKVVQDGVTLGVICTGLEFSHIAGELFPRRDGSVRGFIVDANGIINMDSALLNSNDFLHYEYETQIDGVFTDPALLTALKSYLGGIDDYFSVTGDPSVIRMASAQYRYATIAPIKYTDWSAVILYDPSSSLTMLTFLPAFAVALILSVVFALGSNAITYRLIFHPLERLIHSLERLKKNKDEVIYGLERNDEFGSLSNTIHDLFTKANYDALTGIYNRRFMQDNLKLILEFLSRSNGLFSVLMVDVDYFKKYNDRYGHEEGDICLKAVANALAGSVTRVNDFVARYGGEEFIAALPNADEAGARKIAQKVLDSVRGLNIPHADSSAAPHVTVSIGVTTGKVLYTQSWEDYVKRADEALYMSKHNGRNKYTYLEFKEDIDMTLL